MNIARPDKLTHGQTVLFEIDVLRFSILKLQSAKLDEMDKWIYLEDFLLHYRNLVDFLGHPKPRDSDLHITKPNCFGAGLPGPDVVSELHKEGAALRENAITGSDAISKYLAHCTEQRIVDKSWPVGEMYVNLEKLLPKVEGLLRHESRRWKPQSRIEPLTIFSMSTASPQILAPAILEAGFGHAGAPNTSASTTNKK